MTSFPIHAGSPVSFPGPPPKAADVVVIGGGVVGVTAALFLARRGLRVVLVEKGRIAGEQSSRNWGWIRQQGRDPDELPIMIESRRLWQQLAAETGEDIGLVEAGVTYLATTERKLAAFEAWLPHARAHGLDTRILDAAATAVLIPGASRRFSGALTTPSDMKAEPWCAVPALARLAAREGVSVIESCAARLIDTAAGRVAGVLTEAGRIAAPAVLVAGGAWSSLLLRAHGIAIPQLSVRSTVAATEPLARVHAGAAADDRIAFRLRRDGGFTLAGAGAQDFYLGPDAVRLASKYLPTLRSEPLSVRPRPAAPHHFPDAWGTRRHWQGDEESPFERMRVLDPAPNPGNIARLARNFADLFPRLGPVRLRTCWAGMIDTMPDVVPIIDHCDRLPGLTIGTGLSGHGFGIGPGVGRVLADLIAGGELGHDLTRFRFGRFSDGSRIRPGPAL
ncbi:FAD-binding oxidoreductase [Tropicimonas sp. IMCC34043]|uniref:NAD(P)/FAD-dependent oxidoreductase n=1 Tax=Tropicimonas sp. IMCC34043 TaxID=2248760 RepID=UPI000E224F25|nr:FAD-binding oxidoreductase [Tropicimonas sp. IMCC34043]